MSFARSKIGEKCRSRAFSAFFVVSQSHACICGTNTAENKVIAMVVNTRVMCCCECLVTDCFRSNMV